MSILKKYIEHVINEGSQSPPTQVTDEIFYWNARDKGSISPGFSVPNARPRGWDGKERAQVCEEVFEEIRKKEFSDRPSRLSCKYVCPPESKNCSYGSSNHKVKVTGKVFYTNQEFWTEAMMDAGRVGSRRTQNGKTRTLTLDDIKKDIAYWARDYWQGIDKAHIKSVPIPEVLVDGEVTVIKKSKQ